MLKHIVYFFLTLAFIGIASKQTLAQSETIGSVKETASFGANKFLETEESAPFFIEGEKTKKELELKKLAFEKIITLSSLEIRGLLKKIDGLEDVEAELLPLKKNFTEELENYLDKLIVDADALNNNGDLQSIQSLASDFSEWRESAYNPVVKKVVDFILSEQNKALLKVAEQRFLKIESELNKKTRSAKITIDLWESLLNEAASNLKGARNANTMALALLRDYLPIQDEKIQKSGGLTIRSLVALSLNELKKTYRNFFELGDLVKKATSSK